MNNQVEVAEGFEWKHIKMSLGNVNVICPYFNCSSDTLDVDSVIKLKTNIELSSSQVSPNERS